MPGVKRVLPTVPPQVVVLDEPEECPYLPGTVARRPLRVPMRRLSGVELDERLAEGDRRTGPFLYNQACPTCTACQALRVDVAAFSPSRTQRRVERRGDAAFRSEIGPVIVDEVRVALFAKHELERGLRRRDHALDAEAYARFLVQSCVDGFEIRYLRGGVLAMVAVIDRGAESLSAVYTYYDPALAALSPGTYSILRQIAVARGLGARWLYLGLAIDANRSMAYKAAFRPHERLVEGRWRRVTRLDASASVG